MHYTTCCVESTGEAIRAMVEKAREISYRTFRKHCEGLDDWAQAMGYFRHPSQGLTLKNDWHVTYYKSVFQGKPCYFLVHSAIEYIWT